jgi:hypothetical protein
MAVRLPILPIERTQNGRQLGKNGRGIYKQKNDIYKVRRERFMYE